MAKLPPIAPPAREAKFVPVSDLTPEEKTKLQDIGFNIEGAQEVVTDLAYRMEENNLDANTANQQALDERAENDRLSTVHPDVASAIRESMMEARLSGKEEVQEELKQLDEDYQDAAQDLAQESKKPESPAEKPTDPLQALILEEAKKYDQRMDRIRKTITEADRNAILDEVIRGIPFAKTYSFWNGRVVVVLSTISTKRRLQLQKVIADTIAKEGPLTTSQYDSYIRYYDTCCSLQALTVAGRVVYTRDDQCDIQSLLDKVAVSGPLNSEWTRNLTVSAYREFRDLVTAIVQEASRDVFIDPVSGDTGSTL